MGSHKQAPESFHLEKFNVSRDYGFLPVPDPLLKLPDELAALDELGRDLPKLFRSGRVRSVLEKLPVYPVERLEGADLDRALMLYGFFASAYVHAYGQATAHHIPPGIAIPLYKLATKFGKPPILSYNSYALNNWRRIDQTGPIDLGNLKTIQNFVPFPDEEWFILVHVVIERQAAPALEAIGKAQKAVLEDNAEELTAQLETIALTIKTMYQTLTRMTEGCDPEVYYRDVRPQIMSFIDVVYQGVEDYRDEPQSFRGETGAQSSIVPSLVAALGIRHRQTGLTDYLSDMRKYMPPKHRAFVAAVERGPSIRDYVLRKAQGCPQLRDSYNACIESLHQFRAQHLEFARIYIQERVTDPTGTGGTPFMAWLSLLCDETRQHLIRPAQA